MQALKATSLPRRGSDKTMQQMVVNTAAYTGTPVLFATTRRVAEKGRPPSRAKAQRILHQDKLLRLLMNGDNLIPPFLPSRPWLSVPSHVKRSGLQGR